MDDFEDPLAAGDALRRREPRKRLNVGDAAERNWAWIVGSLRSARRIAGVSQNALSHRLPVRGRAVSEWECGLFEPTTDHLIQWCDSLGQRLVIIDRHGTRLSAEVPYRSGESWEISERRRLVAPLKIRRVASGLSQEQVAAEIGVSRDSVSRWEVARVPMRPMALIVWAQVLGCSVSLQPTGRRNL